jgi:hypothetical protein
MSLRYSKIFLIFIGFIWLSSISSCKVFRKKCDCPDVRRSKRIAHDIHQNKSDFAVYFIQNAG